MFQLLAVLLFHYLPLKQEITVFVDSWTEKEISKPHFGQTPFNMHLVEHSTVELN